MRIAIDAMGGDAGPSVIVDGALVAARHLQVGLLLVGDAAAIESELARHPVASLFRRIDVQIIDAPDRVEMSESAGARAAPEAARVDQGRRRSGPRRPGRRAVQRRPYRRVGDGRARGVRPPARRGSPGAGHHHPDPPRRPRSCSTPAPPSGAGRRTSSSSPSWARPTRASRSVSPSPRVGLLSVGEEESKGNELTREAHQLLKDAPVNFIGNVEGRDVYAGEADVIVCDGFTGNVTLKVSEGLVETVEALLHDELAATFGGRVGYVLSRQAFRRFRRRVDYSEYGGAPLVGLNGLCIVGHGRSSAKAVANAVTMAVRAVDEDLLGRLSRDVARNAALPVTPPIPDPRSPTSGVHHR